MATLRRSTGTNKGGRWLKTVRPLMAMRPVVGRSSPAMQRSMVVLPQPLAPSRTEIDPSSNVSVTAESTGTGPKLLARFSTWMVICPRSSSARRKAPNLEGVILRHERA
jgi:hypothetical protein